MAPNHHKKTKALPANADNKRRALARPVEARQGWNELD